MSCLVPYVQIISPTLSASADNVGDINVRVDEINDLNAEVESIPDLYVEVVHPADSGLTASATSVNSRLSVSVVLSCAINISAPYLEINPSLVWMFDNIADNDVYSNVHWFVD